MRPLALTLVLAATGGCSLLDNSDVNLASVSGAHGAPTLALGYPDNGSTVNVYSLDPSGGANQIGSFSDGYLGVVHVASAEDMWFSGSALHHYDGNAWTQLAQPADPVAYLGDDFAVGRDGTIYALGTAPTVLAAPAPGFALGDFESTWASAANDVWISNGSSVLRYDGAWTDVTPAEAVVTAIGGTSSHDVWLAEVGAMQHYDGAQWGPVARIGSGDSYLESVWATAANDVWAVGAGPFAYHYDGHAWTAMSLPPQNHCGGDGETAGACGDNVSLEAVWASSANDVWITGYTELDVGGFAVLLHYDGTTWSDLSGN